MQACTAKADREKSYKVPASLGMLGMVCMQPGHLWTGNASLKLPHAGQLVCRWPGMPMQAFTSTPSSAPPSFAKMRVLFDRYRCPSTWQQLLHHCSVHTIQLCHERPELCLCGACACVLLGSILPDSAAHALSPSLIT